MCASLETERTRTRHTANPSLVNVQNNDFLVLGQTCITGSVKALGRAGTVHSWRAADVGKYISGHRGFHPTRPNKSRGLKHSNDLVLLLPVSSEQSTPRSSRYEKQECGSSKGGQEWLRNRRRVSKAACCSTDGGERS